MRRFIYSISVIAAGAAMAVSACSGKSDGASGSELAGLDSLPPDIQNVVRAVAANDSATFASMVLYPLQRTYPLHDIADEAAMVAYYPVIMDDSLQQAITVDPGKRWQEYGWRGWSVGDGRFIWYSDGIYAIPRLSAREVEMRDSLVRLEINSLYPELRKDWEPVACYRAVDGDSVYRIDRKHVGSEAPTFRLCRYDSPRQMRARPDMVMTGYRTIDGSAMLETYNFAAVDGIKVSISPDMTDEEGNILIDVDGPGEQSRTIAVRQAYWLDILPR